MNLAINLLLALQVAAPGASESSAGQGRSEKAAIAVAVPASVRVLRPAVIDVATERLAAQGQDDASAARQTGLDAAGTLWIEFS